MFVEKKNKSKCKRCFYKMNRTKILLIHKFIVFRQQSQQNCPCDLGSLEPFPRGCTWRFDRRYCCPSPQTGGGEPLQARCPHPETRSILDHCSMHLKRWKLVQKTFFNRTYLGFFSWTFCEEHISLVQW